MSPSRAEQDRRPDPRAAHLRRLWRDGGRPDAERERLIRLALLLADRDAPAGLGDFLPRYGEHRDRLRERMEGDDGDALEEAFLRLYCHLHGHEAPYTPQERRRLDETGGYWCHAGGISPVLVAPEFLGPGSVLGDFGAGNGLQGLLVQWLRPHRLTVQIEISSRMIEVGKRLQDWLEIPAGRVEWRCGDVLDAAPAGMDVLYLYRPVRPVGEGRRFYERLGAALAADARPLVILSVADCLGPFLPEGFEVLRSDGHLTCYRRT